MQRNKAIAMESYENCVEVMFRVFSGPWSKSSLSQERRSVKRNYATQNILIQFQDIEVYLCIKPIIIIG